MTNESSQPTNVGSSDQLGAAAEARSYPACKGKNCGCTDGRSHSPECRAEHDAATALPYDEKWLHHPDSGTGWKCYVCNYGGTANNYANRFCANCHCSR